VKRLSDLHQKRIAVGPEGSGTRAVALQLLADNDVIIDSSSIFSTGGNDAVKALKQGDLDAAFFVASARSSVVKTLLTTR